MYWPIQRNTVALCVDRDVRAIYTYVDISSHYKQPIQRNNENLLSAVFTAYFVGHSLSS